MRCATSAQDVVGGSFVVISDVEQFLFSRVCITVVKVTEVFSDDSAMSSWEGFNVESVSSPLSSSSSSTLGSASIEICCFFGYLVPLSV